MRLMRTGIQQQLKAVQMHAPAAEPAMGRARHLHLVAGKQNAKALPHKTMETLIQAFQGKQGDLESRLSKSHLSPKTINARVLFLQENIPDGWKEFVTSRSSAFSCSKPDFEKLVAGFMAEANERKFDVELAQRLNEFYGPGMARRLLEIKSGSLLTSEAVLERMEEASKVTGGIPIPAKKAWLLVTNSHTYRKWRNRMIGFQGGISQIKKCKSRELAEHRILEIITSDARSDNNTFRLIDRVQEVYRLHGPGGLHDLLLLSKKGIINGAGKRIKQDGFSRISLERFMMKLRRNHELSIPVQPKIEENTAYLSLSQDNDIGIRITRNAKGGHEIRKIDAQLLGLHLRLFFGRNRMKSAEFAERTLKKLLSKKQWDTRDKIKLWVIRQFAIEHRELHLQMGNKRLKELFQSGPPLHRNYRPDLSAADMVKLCSG